MSKALRVLAAIVLGAVPGLWDPAGLAAQSEPRWEPYHLEAGDGRVDTVELGLLEVPEVRGRAGSSASGGDAAEPSGEVELAFVRLPSRAESPGSPIVYLDGGPGGSGVGIASVPAYHRLFDRLREVADVILLSQRGTGLSRPRLVCGLSSPLPADVFTTRERMVEALRPSVTVCAERWRAEGVRLEGYTTAESADDLESLRRALGAERISLLGFSYGTHLGLAALRRHPESIDRAVLIGTEGPDHTYKLPETLDRQLDHLSALIARDPAVVPDMPDLHAAVDTLFRRLDREPVDLEVGTREGSQVIELGGDGMRYLLRRDIGDTSDHPLWPAAIRLALDGDYRFVQRLAGRRFRELGGVPLMGILMDCASGASPERLERIRSQYEHTQIGAMTDLWYPDICEEVPEARLDDDFRAPFVSRVPTLFLAGTLDANTPPWQAREVAWGWAEATHIVVKQAGHETLMPYGPAQEVIVDFLAGRDVSGRTIELPPLRFMSVEEALALLER